MLAQLFLNLVGARLDGHSLVTLLGDAELDSLALWQRDVSLGALSDGEDVGQSGGEHVTVGIFHVDNFEGSWMFLTVDDGADTTQITSSCDHNQVAGFEFDVIGDFAGRDVDLNGVVDSDGWVGVTHGATVRCDQVWDLLGSHDVSLHLAQLVLQKLKIENS